MTTSAHRAIQFGVRFNPTPAEAISLYLRRWAVGAPLPDTAGIVHEAAVYQFDPKVLVAEFPPLHKTENRFFYTTCKRQRAGKGYRMSRTAGEGSWVSNDKKTVENSAGEKISYRERLRYTYRDKRRESDWLMDEYHLDDEAAVVDGDQERVLCRVYPKTGSVSAAGDLALEPARSTMAVQPRRQEPVAIAQPQAIKKPAVLLLQPRVTVPTPVAITPPQAPKRPAPPQVTEPTAPKRMRVAAALPPLVLPPPGPRHDVVVGWNTPKQPSWYRAPVLPHAPIATRSPVAAPSRPAAEAPATEMDVDAEAELDMTAVEEDHGISQEEEVDDLARWLEGELPIDEEHAKVQEEEEDGDLATWLEGELPHDEEEEEEGQLEKAPIDEDHVVITQEEAGNDGDAGFVGELEVEPQGEADGQHQHASSLEGLVVDDRGDDDVVAQDFFEGMADPIDGEDQEWLCKSLADYAGNLQY